MAAEAPFLAHYAVAAYVTVDAYGDDPDALDAARKAAERAVLAASDAVGHLGVDILGEIELVHLDELPAVPR